jgi:heme oxygenase
MCLDGWMHDEARPVLAAGALADALRSRTRSLHREAESSGIMHDLLRGVGSRRGYALLLRNLLPVYRELEAGLERLKHAPGVRTIQEPALCRVHPIESDLASLYGAQWPRSLPLLDAGERYADVVSAAGRGDGARLIAHAYVRYLGDLNGGRVMKERLRRTLGLDTQQLAFFEFPGIADLDRFRSRYRLSFDLAASDLPDLEPVLAEAELAFRLNIDLSCAVQASAVA